MVYGDQKMAYLVCDQCDVYYEIHSDGAPMELGYCDCGNQLKYFESLEDYLKSKGKIKNKPPTRDEHLESIITAYESIIAKLILYCVTQLPFNVGVQKLLDVLKGSRSIFILDHNLHELSTYSILSNFNKDALELLINYLVHNGYLEVIENVKRPELTTLQITDNGDRFISTGESINPFLVEENIIKRIPPYDEVLYQELRGLRKMLAEENNIPLYQVCGNNILLKLARHQPTDPNSMSKIRGIGRVFMEKYSNYFLNQIIAYKQR